MKTRNYGIDFLRMLSMLGVVILHILGQGGVYGVAVPLTGAYEMAWLMEITAFCSVNCFALISGYVGVDSKYKVDKIVYMWFQVVGYTLLITACYTVLFQKYIIWEQWIDAIFPVTKAQYWYFRAYFAMFFFIPFLNKMLNSLSREALCQLGIAIILIFSIWPLVVGSDLFLTKNGYTVLWITLLYLLGGILKKLDFQTRVKKFSCCMLFGGMILLTWGWKFCIESKFTENEYANIWIDYTSPTILLAAVSLVLLFAQCEYKNGALKKLITIGAPSAFSVYLIHTHPLIYENILKHRFDYIAQYSPVHLFIAVMSIAICIYVGCTIMDLGRIWIYKRLKIRELSLFIGQKLVKIFTIVENSLIKEDNA